MNLKNLTVRPSHISSLYKTPFSVHNPKSLSLTNLPTQASLALSLSPTMAETVAVMPIDTVPTKKRSTRRALKEKTPSTNEANILAGKVSPSLVPPPPANDPEKENHESLSQPRTSPKKGKARASKKQTKQQQKQQPEQDSFEKDLLEMQERLQKLRLEKEKTEELLKAKDEILKQKEEELETRGRQQEKLQTELKKLQKLKEFKPTVVSFLHPLFLFLRPLGFSL